MTRRRLSSWRIGIRCEAREAPEGLENPNRMGENRDEFWGLTVVGVGMKESVEWLNQGIRRRMIRPGIGMLRKPS